MGVTQLNEMYLTEMYLLDAKQVRCPSDSLGKGVAVADNTDSVMIDTQDQ